MSKAKRKYSKRTEVRVKSLLQCPICGATSTLRVVWGNRFTKCRACHTRLFNHSATEKFGVADDRGFYYHINTVFVSKEGDDDFNSLDLLKEMEVNQNEQRIARSIGKRRAFEIRSRLF